MNASTKLLERVLPATVHVQVQVPAEHPSAPILGAKRAGAGTLVDSKGFILTTQYIVVGASQLEVTLLDGTKVPAELAAQDFATGIAVLQITARALPAATLSSSGGLVPGQDVFLVASAGDSARRASSGGVMSLDAFDAFWEFSIERAIVTTAINPGLSGGAVFDCLGRMVGVVALDLNEIGRFTLAIPVENFLDHRDELIQYGRRTSRPRRAWVGFYCYSFREHVVIAGVFPGTPGAHAGLKAGDVLLTVDGQKVHARRTLYQQLWSHRPGEQINCTVYRGDKVTRLTIEAGDAEEFFA